MYNAITMTLTMTVSCAPQSYRRRACSMQARSGSQTSSRLRRRQSCACGRGQTQVNARVWHSSGQLDAQTNLNAIRAPPPRRRRVGLTHGLTKNFQGLRRSDMIFSTHSTVNMASTIRSSPCMICVPRQSIRASAHCHSSLSVNPFQWTNDPLSQGRRRGAGCGVRQAQWGCPCTRALANARSRYHGPQP